MKKCSSSSPSPWGPCSWAAPRRRSDRLNDENAAFRDPRLVHGALDIKASNGIIHTINRVLLPAVI